jgi:SSS family solute:Na+ symporter/sodium/pantothenate symporter
MWTFSTAGQPSNMVRLMAFDRPRTLSRAIFAVSIYYTLIYVPLLVIFCCARVLLPGWETEPDRIMPEMARLTSELAQAPWLAGFLLAAPFAAVMSTMDSFLLMISSAVVRDIYQRNFNPQASELVIKRMTHATTLLVGGAAMVAAINPPKFLQDIIVFTGTGLSTTFLAPVFLLLYWPRFNLPGALSGIWAGVTSHVLLYAIGTWLHPERQMTAYEPGGFHPFFCGTLVSWLVAVVVTLATPPSARSQVHVYFGPPPSNTGIRRDADL